MALISIKEAARRLGKPERTLYNWIDSGSVIIHKMVNGRIGIDEAEIRRIQEEMDIAQNANQSSDVVERLEENINRLSNRIALLEYQLEEVTTRLTMVEDRSRTPVVKSPPIQTKQVSQGKRSYHRKPENSNQPPNTITVAELAYEMDITSRTLREHIANHKLPHISIEKRIKQDGTVEHDRYFTPEHVEQIKTWHAQHGRK